MEFNIPLNSTGTESLIVDQEHSAKILGSGEVEVLATPMMIALMEAASLYTAQVYLPSDWTTVGTQVNVEHLRPTPLGQRVTATATLVKQEGRTLQFQVEARDHFGLIGQGTHHRFIINIESFMDKIKHPKG
jgi:predicted thioesterase